MSSDNSMMLMTISSGDSRSVSPMTPSPSREIKGIRLFRAISRKLARCSHDDLTFGEDGDSRSSSTDSFSSTSAGRCSRSKKITQDSSAESGYRSVSPHHLSSSSSDTGSDDIQTCKQKHQHSTSAESIRKVFQGLTVSSRSKSCTNTKDTKRKTSNKTAPKKILRTPVAYTYVKGLSGLPTQRIPKSIPRVHVNSACSCMQYSYGLNR